MFQYLSAYQKHHLKKKITSLRLAPILVCDISLKTSHLLLVPFCKALFSLQAQYTLFGKFLHGKKAANLIFS